MVGLVSVLEIVFHLYESRLRPTACGATESWTSRWQTPETTEKLRLGDWGLSAARRYGNLPPRWGLQTKQDSHSYALWRPLEAFSNAGRSLLFQVICLTCITRHASIARTSPRHCSTFCALATVHSQA